MYAASLLFSRLTLIATIAFPAFVFMLGISHQTMEPEVIPPCHHVQVDVATVEIEEAAFGISEWFEADGYRFFETDHVHLVPGTVFGWRLKLREPMSSVMLREEFVLPSAPSYWGLGPGTRLSEDRTTAITERRLAPGEELLTREWTVTAGDPVGAYEMRVFLDDQLVKTFKFDAHADH